MRTLRLLTMMLFVVVAIAVIADARGPSRNITVERMRSESRVALVIGNGSDAPLAELENPLNDVNDARNAAVRLADGTIRRAEIHWYEAHGFGRKDFKISCLFPEAPEACERVADVRHVRRQRK